MKFKLLNTTLPGLILFVSSLLNVANAGLIVDQVNDQNFTVSYNGTASILNWQQEVTSGIDGTLSSIDLYFHQAGSIKFYVNLGNAWQNDTHDYFKESLSVKAGWNNIDISTSAMAVSLGDIFVFGLSGLDNGPLDFAGSTSNQYSNGRLYLSFNSDTANEYEDGFDIGFRTYVNQSTSIPEPSTVVIFALGLMCIASLKLFSAWAIRLGTKPQQKVCCSC